jgi:hypothetical protein
MAAHVGKIRDSIDPYFVDAVGAAQLAHRFVKDTSFLIDATEEQ